MNALIICQSPFQRFLTSLSDICNVETSDFSSHYIILGKQETCVFFYAQKSLSQLLDDAEKEKKRAEMSADEPGIRKKLREQIYDEMSGDELRAHAPKMQLKDSEHDALELVSFSSLCSYSASLR